MSAYSKEVQNRENSSFKESKSLNSEDQKWTEAGFRKDSTGKWVLKREEGWNKAIIIGFYPPYDSFTLCEWLQGNFLRLEK
jgi:hypothetical protein